MTVVGKEDKCQEYQLLRLNYQRVTPIHVINFKQDDSYFAIKYSFFLFNPEFQVMY